MIRNRDVYPAKAGDSVVGANVGILPVLCYIPPHTAPALLEPLNTIFSGGLSRAWIWHHHENAPDRILHSFQRDGN